jgi:hypothetical protein
MPSEPFSDVKLEIGHVLFIDIVGYSKLLITEQSDQLQTLRQILRGTEQFKKAEAEGKLLRLSTGDGGALVFRNSPEAPVLCALEISKALRSHPELKVRMGIHSGPVNEITDLNEQANIAGAGINIAQRVMDCGDAGHILVSKRVADDLAQQRRWHPYLHELGDVEVKHGVVVSLVNFYAETIGNPAPPARIGKLRGTVPRAKTAARKGLSPLARTVFIVVVLLIGLAIVSVIFAPAIMRSVDKNAAASAPQPSATASPSFSDAIQNMVKQRITDELQRDLSRKNTAPTPGVTPSPKSQPPPP